MDTSKTVNYLLIALFFVFSCWLMTKSFSYDPKTHEFIIARNVVGDFGLHLSLIRSVSWGKNIPVESPFYPGVQMPYHYGFDVMAGLLERAGARIDIAYNGISALACTVLLYVIYLLPQRIFGKSRFMGIVSVILFVFHSGLTFMDFFSGKSLSFSLLKDIWRIPNYIHAGPFDGSLLSTFFTLNVYVNQRHTVAALALGLWIIYAVLGNKKQKLSVLLALGFILGFSGWIHTLLFACFCLVIFTLCILYKKYRYIVPLFLPAAVLFLPRVISILRVTGSTGHPFFNPGFLSARPFTLQSFLFYWWLNLGIAVVLLPLGFVKSGKKQKLFFIPFFLLFVIANIFQLSYRIDHNHTLINLFIIVANMYIARLLCILWKKRIFMKIVAAGLFAALTLSGVLDLMVIKNDYHLRVADAPKNPLMLWIKTNTDPGAVFISKRQLLDPVTLSGRKNYVGHDYYLSVMGYSYDDRLRLVEKIYATHDPDAIQAVKNQGVQYIMYDTEKFFRIETL